MKILQILIIIIFYTIFVNAQPIGWEDAAFGGGDTWDDDGEFGLIHFFLLFVLDVYPLETSQNITKIHPKHPKTIPKIPPNTASKSPPKHSQTPPQNRLKMLNSHILNQSSELCFM